ncbi:MAG: nucleotide exchange factor GrpE [Methanobrevibacter sp.]|uniref:nucleotide exchange factor GrpE n=1 Tax=Methanobrevibacter sp. TaxID=66852 RepID=UPI0025DB00B6|nr:nucleotide exchange factor GrpE [Methanobrevibacter sp.]MBQ6099762.1 nucleotide exchange factor GrpE [Methanobrevibacter sp.]
MTDEKKSETEVNEEDLQEKTEEEPIDELALKDEEIAKLKEDLKKQEAETQEYISLSQRLQADFENFKKITDKQNKEIIKFANENIIKEFLDCYEDFGRALEIENDDNLREGIELTYNKFKDILTKQGVEEIPAKGEKFDLNKHEALMVQKSDDVENGYVIDELMKGYMYKDKVLKYSKVIVCKK